jgi:transcriptional regulator with XRE-family HTH domain
MSTLGSRIAKLRKEYGYTMREFGKLCNLSHSYINDIEKDRTSPSLEALKTIAQNLNTTVSFLLGEEINSERQTKNNYSNTNNKICQNLDKYDLPDEAIKQIEDYIEFIKLKYKNNRANNKNKE